MFLFESMLINCENEIQKADYFINVNTGILDGTFWTSTKYFYKLLYYL